MYGCVWLCIVVYSWGGQLYTKLNTEYQWFKRISAGLTGFFGDKKMRIGSAFLHAASGCDGPGW